MDSSQEQGVELESSTPLSITDSEVRPPGSEVSTLHQTGEYSTDDEASRGAETEDSEDEHKEDPVADENQEKLKKHNLKKIISTVGTVIALIFGGAGAMYGIEGKHEEHETGVIEQWKYLNCVYFCVVTLTTIGYGDLSPKTSAGKGFVIAYAIISLGVMAAAVTTIGQIIVLRANQHKNDFMKVSKMFTKKLRGLTKLSGSHDPKDIKSSMESELATLEQKKKKKTRWYMRLAGLLTLLMITILVGARVFEHFEGWKYGDAIYYCFITLLTIGYGDFYPHTDGGKIFFIFYVFFGLGLLAFVVGDIGETVISQTHAELQEAKMRKALMSNLNQLSKLKALNPVGKLGKPKLPGGLMKKIKRDSKKVEKGAKEGGSEPQKPGEAGEISGTGAEM